MSGYPQTLKYFMWPWQVYFRISCQTSAEGIFNQLDRNLKPQVFLLGFHTKKDNKDDAPVCIDPEQITYSLDEFKSINDLAHQLYQNNEDRKLFYTGEGMQGQMDRRLHARSHREAIEKTLNESPNNPGNICFASSPVIMGEYSVYVILELDRSVFEAHLKLKKAKWDRYTIFRSIVEASVSVYLREMTRNLYMPDPGKNLSADSKSTEELLNSAAMHFMYTISINGKDGHGLHGLFPACNQISIHRYEKTENIGYLIIAEENHADIEMTLTLEAPFSINDYRKARKLFQLTNETIGVVCNSYQVLGFGKIKNSYNPESESIFEIRFRGIHCWDIEHNKETLLQMRYGNPQTFRESIDKAKVHEDAKRIFPQITESQFDNLVSLFLAATKQKKGAMLIVSGAAKEESIRLEKQSISIRPISLTSEMVLTLSSIDGGILMDIDGTAYAYGVILDGIVGKKGNPARGSRYNSAITYQEYHGVKNSTMIIVVSEDGMVDIIPTLMPQVKHSEILSVINALEELNSVEKFNRSAFNDTMRWLTNREFYLTLEECNRINLLKKNIENIDMGTSLRIVYEDFHPNLEMNESYYSDNVNSN